MFLFFAFIFAFILLVPAFMHLPKFGELPQGKRLGRVKDSPNYKQGAFRNAEHTPDLTEGSSLPKVMWEFFTTRNPNRKPTSILPSRKTDLKNLDPDQNVLVWFGHSSYFMQLDGRKILVDPVFSGAASPIRFTTRSFPGTDVYIPEDMPEIDYLFLTHDHWDHLDYKTIIRLRPKIKKIVTSLGVGAHLERWKISSEKILELDWNNETSLEEEFHIRAIAARHFSGRGFKRNQSIWSSFILSSPTMKVYIGGDSGYGAHFLETGNTYGPFDLAILECGQYNVHWKYIHMMPEETLKAAGDLKAKALLPVHWGKFSLAIHDWNEPIRRIQHASGSFSGDILTPLIGEAVDMDTKTVFPSWWENI